MLFFLAIWFYTLASSMTVFVRLFLTNTVTSFVGTFFASASGIVSLNAILVASSQTFILDMQVCSGNALLEKTLLFKANTKFEPITPLLASGH